MFFSLAVHIVSPAFDCSCRTSTFDAPRPGNVRCDTIAAPDIPYVREKVIFMRSEVTVTFPDTAPFRVDLDRVEPMQPEAARAWLDRQFTELECEPLRPTGKLLSADKVVVVAESAGASRFKDPAWAQEFARAASATLHKPAVHIDVATMTVSF
jgi:hypothetical protein